MNINNSNKTLFRFNHNLKEYIIKVKMLYYIFNVYLKCLLSAFNGFIVSVIPHTINLLKKLI